MWKISLQEYIKGQLVSIQCTDIIEVKKRMKKNEPTKHAIQLFYQLYTPISRKKGNKVEWVFSKSVGESSVFMGIGWSQCWINRWAGAQLSLQSFAFIITALLSLSSNFKSFSLDRNSILPKNIVNLVKPENMLMLILASCDNGQFPG